MLDIEVWSGRYDFFVYVLVLNFVGVVILIYIFFFYEVWKGMMEIFKNVESCWNCLCWY